MSKGPLAPKALPVRLDQLDPLEQKEQRVLREQLDPLVRLDLQDRRVVKGRQDLLDSSARRELLAPLARQDPLVRLDLQGPLDLAARLAPQVCCQCRHSAAWFCPADRA
jgi:hypothetical protein